jgi:hypothetical protein
MSYFFETSAPARAGHYLVYGARSSHHFYDFLLQYLLTFNARRAELQLQVVDDAAVNLKGHPWRLVKKVFGICRGVYKLYRNRRNP